MAGNGLLTISVNISAIEFDQVSLLRSVSQVLTETGIPVEMLELEISESILMQDVEKSLQVLRSFKDLGIKIALDNFGSSYSSLRYLKDFSIDILKIDRSLIHAMIANPDSSVMVSTMIGLANQLDIPVQAVGVETKEQFDFLHQLGCQRAQGYLFSKPKRAQDVLQFLAQRRTGTLA